MHQWQKFGENLSTDAGVMVEEGKSGMHSLMPWPWTLTFWPQNLISSSLSRDAPVTKVWRKSVNRYWRYRGNIRLPRESRTDARTAARRTTRKHIASAGAYWRRRLKKHMIEGLTSLYQTQSLWPTVLLDGGHGRIGPWIRHWLRTATCIPEVGERRRSTVPKL